MIKKLIGLVIGIRKFSVILMLVAVAVIFRLTNHLSGQNFVDLLVPVAVAFMGTNMAEHALNMAKEFLSKK